ncbi:hypothetical protein Dimus_019842 [Dionaea muscipula]
MYQALPYKTWATWPPAEATATTTTTMTSTGPFNRHRSPASVVGIREDVTGIVLESAVMVFGMRGCCMIHVVRQLLLGLGVNPPVYEVDDLQGDDIEKDVVVKELAQMIGAAAGVTEAGGDRGRQLELQLPVVFIGGKLFGGLDRIMAAHITGELTPILREAGALWL